MLMILYDFVSYVKVPVEQRKKEMKLVSQSLIIAIFCVFLFSSGMYVFFPITYDIIVKRKLKRTELSIKCIAFFALKLFVLTLGIVLKQKT